MSIVECLHYRDRSAGAIPVRAAPVTFTPRQPDLNPPAGVTYIR
ncbi:hypothetical protein [Methanoregula sp.]